MDIIIPSSHDLGAFEVRRTLPNKALGDLPGQRVHALAIKATAPGE